jgi:hypothetical protein
VHNFNFSTGIIPIRMPKFNELIFNCLTSFYKIKLFENGQFDFEFDTV